MSSHESVSCDSCMKANFKGKRYKCLICYDYDLCSTCYEGGVTTGRHSTDHAMQCILTRADFELYYGGDTVATDQPQSFTCPYCGSMGFSEDTLSDHVTSLHSDSSTEVICPICAAQPGGDPNMVSDDFQDHLAMEHRSGRGSLHVYEAELPGNMHRAQRRLATSSRRGNRQRHYTPSTTSSMANSQSAILRESMDPIAELLSHLSGVHNRLRTPQQLRDIQMQIEAERQAIRIPADSLSSYREHLQRLPRRAGMLYEPVAQGSSAANSTNEPSKSAASSTQPPTNSTQNKSLLLSKYLKGPEISGKEQEQREKSNAERSLFIQEVLLATLTDTNLSIRNSNESQALDTNSSISKEICSLSLASNEETQISDHSPTSEATIPKKSDNGGKN